MNKEKDTHDLSDEYEVESYDDIFDPSEFDDIEPDLDDVDQHLDLDDISEISADSIENSNFVPDQVISSAQVAYNQDPPKKKSSLMSVFLIALVVLGGAGAYFSGFLGGGPSSQLTSRPYQAPGNISSDSEHTDSLADTSQEYAADDVNVTMDDSLDRETIPEEIQSEDDIFADFERPGTDLSVDLDEEESLIQSPSTEEAMLAYPENQEAEKVADDNNLVSSDSGFSLSQVDTAQLRALTGKLSSLEAELSSSQKKFADKIVDLEQQVQKGGLNATEMSGLQDDLRAIQKQLSTLSSRLDKIEKTASARVTIPQDEPKSRKVDSQKSVEKRSTAETKTTSSATAVKPSVTTPKWEIRAIQVGSAVIAEKGHAETRSIAIGDNVPGLGTIKEINYKNGGWVIEGSSNSIKY